jgi:hypothetical protein
MIDDRTIYEVMSGNKNMMPIELFDGKMVWVLFSPACSSGGRSYFGFKMLKTM